MSGTGDLNDEYYWFLKSPAEIKKLQEELPPVAQPLADAFLDAFSKAKAKGLEKQFLEAFLGYIQATGSNVVSLILVACEDWDIKTNPNDYY